jgi:N-acetylglucosaminyl-diphospho-decaprenol L-rhamnosyltransferase
VVDNASSDGSADVARDREADVVIANDRNLGFARAVNLGLAACSSEHVLLLNPDAELGQAALASMRAVLREQTGAAIVAPLLRDPQGVTESGASRFATLTRRVGLCLPLVGRAPYFRPQYRLLPDVCAAGRALDVDYVFGAAMLVDRAFLAAAGGLDERFFLFAEDEDICRQARAAGRRVLLDTRAVARHIGGASCGDEVRTEAQRLYSTYLLFEKWRGSRAARIYHGGILQASRLRVAAARTERRPEAAAEVRTIARMFDEAIRRGVDPLLAEQADAASAPRPTRRGGRW